MKPVTIYTIGYTRQSAEEFFEKLKKSGTKRIIDVRLHNVSQLAGFAKKDDLRYFLKEIGGLDYLHMPDLFAPTPDILDAYRKRKGSWEEYEKNFLQLLRHRKIENHVSRDIMHEGCLLCSEDTPHHCHRRLVAEYLQKKWDEEVEIRHI
ncbi:MAG: DUF488 family protein [bacterium]|jgi:uncharacterized protein (DUF488 family)